MMNLIRQFFKKREPLLLVLTLASLVLPGVATVYLLNQQLFNELDWVKLVLLSSSMTMPFMLMSAIGIDTIVKPDSQDPKDFVNSFCLGSMMTGLIFYAALVVHFYTILGTFISFTPSLFIGVVLMLGVVYSDREIEKRKGKPE